RSRKMPTIRLRSGQAPLAKSTRERWDTCLKRRTTWLTSQRLRLGILHHTRRMCESCAATSKHCRRRILGRDSWTIYLSAPPSRPFVSPQILPLPVESWPALRPAEICARRIGTVVLPFLSSQLSRNIFLKADQR